MPDAGARTTDIDTLPAVDDLLGHRDGTVGRVLTDTLAIQLAATGALADRMTTLESATSYASLLRPSWAALAELTPSGIGQRAEVADSDTGSHTDPQSSETVDNAGQYTAFGTGVGDWTWVQPTGLSGKADADSVVALTGDQTVAGVKTFSTAPVVPDAAFPLSKVAGATASARRASDVAHAAAITAEPVAENAPTSIFAVSSAYADWALGFDVGTDLAAGDGIDVVRTHLDIAATTQTLRVTIWRRDISDAGAAGAGPGQSGDVALQTRDVPVSDTGLAVGVPATVDLPIEHFEAAAGVCYLVEIDARTAADARDALGIGWLSKSSTQRRSGYFRASGSPATWSNISTASAIGITLARSVAVEAADTAAEIAALQDACTGLGGALEADLYRQAAALGESEFVLATGFYSWAQAIVGGTDVAAGTPVTGYRMPLAVATGTTQVRLRMWSRPIGASWEAQPPGFAFDRREADVTATIADLGLTAGSATLTEAVLRFDRVVIEAGRLYIWEIEALNGSGTRLRSAITYRTEAGLSTDQLRKFWRSGATSSWSAGVTATTYRFPFDLVIDGYAAPASPILSDRIVSASAEVIGNSVIVEATVARSGGQQRISGRVALDAPASGTVTDEALTLTPRGGAAVLWSYLRDRTAHAQLSNVVVERASDSAVLVKNTDYALIEELGCLSLFPTSGTNLDVLVSYDWQDQRYDLISYVPGTGAIAVTKGTDAARDAQERIPATPAGHVPLFNIRLGATTGTEALPVWDVSPAGVRRTIAAEVEEEDARNRRLLRPVLRQLRAGAAVKLLSYGDSNFAQMGGGYSLAAVRSAANTIYHDRTRDTGGLLQDPPLGADILAGITLYDTGDGAGAVHTRFGLVWELIRALQDAYASTITYENRSIPGTNSTSSTYHGLDSVRLSAATGAAADLAIIGFGQNELGQTYTRANVIDICAAFVAAGTVPVVMGCFRPNRADLNTVHTTERWRTTQRALREAALAVDVPYVGTEALYEDGEALGLSRYDHCAATLDVHPGPYEVGRIGARLAAVFMD